MPRPTEQRIEHVQPLQENSREAPTRVTAHAVDTFVDPGQGNLNGLLEGLASIKPSLNRYIQKEDHRQAQEAHDAGVVAGQLNIDPNKNLLNPDTMPQHVNPAYKGNFEEGYKSAIGLTLGNKSRDAMMLEYKQKREQTGFDVEGWLKDWTNKEYAGITDPHVLTQMAKVHSETVRSIREDFRTQQLKELDASNKRTAGEALTSSITADMSPTTMGQVYHYGFLPKALASGAMNRTEAALAFTEHVRALSLKAGGQPELFDALYVPDDTGMSPATSDPKLRLAIETARAEATKLRDASMSDEQLQSNARIKGEIMDHIKNGRFDEVSDDKLLKLVGKRNVISSDGEYQTIRAARDKAMEGQALITTATRDAGNGKLFGYDEKVQKSVIQSLTNTPVEEFKASLNATGPEATAARTGAMTKILNIVAGTGVNQAEPRLKEFFGGIGSAIPMKDAAPPPRFDAAVDAFSALKSQAPHLMNNYFDEDTRIVLETYTAARNNGEEPKLAYQRAYQSVSPEAKERAKKLESDPTFRAKVDNEVKSVPVSTWRTLIPFGKSLGLYPTNTDVMQAAAEIEVKRFMREHPDQGIDQAMEHAKGWAASSFVHDTEHNLLVQVPAGKASEAAGAAFAHYSKQIKQQYGQDSGIEFRFNGKDGYSVATTKPFRLVGSNVSFDDIMKQHYNANHLDEQERAQMHTLRQKIASNQITAEEMNANSGLIAKAKQVGALGPLEQSRLNATPRSTMAVSPLFQYSSRLPMSNDNLDASRLPPTAAKTDVASAFLKQGNPFGALTAMGEGVVLRAYPDPSRGTNIGIGYNMEANASTIHEDFRRAGIPVEQIEQIKAGKREITTDQAMRLYQAVQPRYVSMAKSQVEKLHPGSWDKLPDNHQAVLTDLAYQTGNVGQFKKALEALTSGNMQLAGEGFKTFYKDRKTGEMVADSGRHNLRMHMLNNPSFFGNIVGRIAKRPRNIIQARVGD